MERTFAMIKPSCTKYVAEVENAIAAANLTVAQVKDKNFSREEAEEFYVEHKGKPFFDGLVSMLSSAPVRAYELVGEDAVKVWRGLIGPTNPNNGDGLRHKFADGAAYAAGSPDNGFHGSANSADAAREIKLVFE